MTAALLDGNAFLAYVKEDLRARCAALDHRIGTLTPGKKADIVMLRTNDVNMAPVYDPIYSIVEIAGAGGRCGLCLPAFHDLNR